MQRDTSIPIVFAFDDGFALPGSIAIASLVQAAKPTTRYNIIVLHDGLPTDTQDKLAQSVAGTTHQLEFHFLQQDIIAGAPSSKKMAPNRLRAAVYSQAVSPVREGHLFRCRRSVQMRSDLVV